MHTNYKILLAFILGIIARIITTPWLLGFSNEYYSIHKNKIYDAIFFGSITGLIQVIIDIGYLSNAQKLFWLILYSTIFYITSHSITYQNFVNERDLLLKLRENYAESIAISQIHIDKNIEPNVKQFLTVHADVRKQAIKDLDQLLKKIK